jgi:hypothetical protein
MTDKVRRTIWFEPEVWSQLEAAIETSGKTMTGIVNEAVQQYLQSSQDAEERYRAIEARLSAIEARLGITRE